MNHWPFVIAAYALTGLSTMGLALQTLRAMRRAEKAVELVNTR
jgi:heme exporter protein D